MFEFVRKHSKIVMILLFLLIIPSFILVGIDGYQRSSEKSAAVATVGGHDITQAEWDAAHTAEVERIRASAPSVDARLLESPEARYATLERLVRERVLLGAAADGLLSPSDAALARRLQEDPGIAALRRPDGSMDIEQYRAALARQNMTPEMFEARIRSDLASRQVLAGIAGTEIPVAAMADVALDALLERRDVHVAVFKPQDYVGKVQVTDADLEAYYKAHTDAFRRPEQVDIEYVVLDPAAVRDTIAPSESDLRGYYEQNLARMTTPEERRASHILITVPKDAPAADREKAKARAAELLAQARANPGSFAELARKNSQDPGSAASGGDLGFFARGAMVKPFEDAAFALQKGQIGDLVESDFGYHVIQLADIKPGEQRSFEEARPELEAEYRQQAAQRRFAEVADNFGNSVYEQADALAPVAEKLRLKLRTAEGVTREPAPGATGALANPQFLQALFSADAIEKKRNTAAVEIGPSQLAAGRVVRHTPARVAPFDEVRAQVRERLVAERALALAKEDGAAKLAAWKAKPADAVLPQSGVIVRNQRPPFAAAIVDAAMRLPVASLPALAGADLGQEGYAVIRLDKVEARVKDPAQEQQGREQFANWWGTAEADAYYRLLQERAKVQIKVPKPVGALRLG
ncbi:MAG: SurA N-terminal domain-containing protein [Xylophilus ampelinus]